MNNSIDWFEFTVGLLAFIACYFVGFRFGFNAGSTKARSAQIQTVQALDAPGHIIVQVKGKGLQVSHFTPDLKVQWVTEEEKQ